MALHFLNKFNIQEFKYKSLYSEAKMDLIKFTIIVLSSSGPCILDNFEYALSYIEPVCFAFLLQFPKDNVRFHFSNTFRYNRTSAFIFIFIF